MTFFQPEWDEPGEREVRRGLAGPRRRRYLIAGVLAAVVVLVAAGSLAFGLSGHTKAGPAGGGRQAAAAGQVARAASWVASQVSVAAVVSCDPVTCRALRAHGVPATRLEPLSPGSTGPLRSRVIVATAAVRQQFGRRLDAAYAPAVLASFGSGTLRIDIRAVAAHGAAAYLSAVRADVLARKAAAAPLLHSQRIVVAAPARAQLAGGLVDARLLVTIAGLAATHPVSILAFGDLAPGASPGIPLRSVEVAATGAGGARNSADLQPMVRFLRSRSGPYRPARIEAVVLPGGQAAVRIEFAAPSPLGLLAPSGG